MYNYSNDLPLAEFCGDKRRGEVTSQTYTGDYNGVSSSAGAEDSYEYTGNGSLSKKREQINNVYIKEYVYNAREQLTSYKESGALKGSYTYDAEGYRASKTVGGVTTRFYWDRGFTANESDGTNFTAKNTIGSGGIVSRKLGTATPMYLMKDVHGDTTEVLQNRATVGTYDYDAFGKQLTSSGTVDNPYRYCGEYIDKETGLIYLRNRYYDPKLGRFMSEDPAKSGLNWYVYCENNPLKFVDPWGLWGANVHWGETKKWASAWVGTKGFTEYDAGMLAFYDNNTDAVENGISPFPAIGDQSYHFNTNATGVDSRLQHAAENLNNAIWAWNQAKINYTNNLKNLENFVPGSAAYKAEERRINNLYRADKDYALKFLGEGLHAIQDIEAHGNITKGWWISGHISMEGVDDINYDWTDLSRTNVERSVNQRRFKNTENATNNYLALFFDGIN